MLFRSAFFLDFYSYFYAEAKQNKPVKLKNHFLAKTFSGLLLLLLAFGCKSNFGSGRMQEGMIQYRIQYDTGGTGMAVQLMPKTMILKFKNHLSTNKIAGFMGLVEICNYSDARKQTNTTCLKFFNNKYSYTSGKDEPLCCFDPFKDMTIENIDGETKVIAGYTCKKAMARFPLDQNKDFEIYYTDEIKVQSPNQNNPFHDIKGILMQFTLKMNKLMMHITAESVKPAEFTSEDFKIPDGYRAISKQRMEECLYTLME